MYLRGVCILLLLDGMFCISLRSIVQVPGDAATASLVLGWIEVLRPEEPSGATGASYS